MVSKEGKYFREQLCKIIADAMCQWMIKLFGQGITASQYSRVTIADVPSNVESGLSSRSSVPAYDYNPIFRDRRLRVIFSKILKSASSDKILMLRFCLASMVILIKASTLACHQVIVSMSEAYLVPLFDAPKRYAVSAWYLVWTFSFVNWKRAFLSNYFQQSRSRRIIYMDNKIVKVHLLAANWSHCICN